MMIEFLWPAIQLVCEIWRTLNPIAATRRGAASPATAPVHELKLLALKFTLQDRVFVSIAFFIFKFRILTCYTQHSGGVLVHFYTCKRFKAVGGRDAHDRGYLRR